ncbi:MAG: MFS transporter [Thermoguttaceae bacterium]|nr:MFS transporter [Thermoguttaceae bacterium]
MSESKSVALAYPRLCLAYFLQFAVWGSYGFALYSYALNVLNFSGPQVGWIGAAIPIGALFAPLVGRIADRFLSAQYVLSILQFISAGLLIFAGLQKDFTPMMVALVLVGSFYMPTIPLINSIVYRHVPKKNPDDPNEDNAPRVFMFGTIGWIVIVLIIQAFFGGDQTPQFFYVGAACSLLLAIYALTLPDTPPKPVETTSTQKAPSAWTLIAQPQFLCFTIAILIAGIAACGFFFTTCQSMLTQRGYPGGLALTTLNQISEVLFMALLPIFVKRIGLKNVILIGIGAWLARYVCFMEAAFGFALVGLLLHGLCYSFLYAGSYKFGDKIAPETMKASVQSFIGMILLGVGQIVGALLAGYLIGWSPALVSNYQVTEGNAVVLNVTADNVQNLPRWTDPAAAKSVWNILDLGQYVKPQNVKDEETKAAAKNLDLTSIDTNKDGKITAPELADVISADKSNTIPKEVVTSLLTQVQSKLAGKDVKAEEINITREQYLQAQTNDWKKIYMVPAIMMAAAFIFFLLFGKNPTEENKEDEAQPEEAQPAEA